MMPKLPQRAKNLALAGAASLAGFAAVIITFSALFLGLWLDATFGTRAAWTITLTVLSVPLSLYTMFRLVLVLVGKIVPQASTKAKDTEHIDVLEEESH